MRGTWSIVALLFAVSGGGCLGLHDKPKRIMRPPAEQIYELPPLDDDKYSRPPDYPKDAPTPPGQQKSSMPKGMGGGSSTIPMASPSAGGASMGR